MTFRTIAAAVALLAVPTFAIAQEDITVQSREPVSINVSTAGLDLGTVEGLQALRGRMTKAIAAACNPGDRLNADMAPDWQCRREMAANAETQMLRIANANAVSGRIASN